MEDSHPNTSETNGEIKTPIRSSGGPSKQFLIRGGIALGIIAVILVVQTSWFRALFHKKPLTAKNGVVVGDLIAKDSNGNGIPDWEERLWGLDPTVLYTNGKSNEQIIKEKKLAAGISPTVDNTPLTQTDQIAQSLFSLTNAVGQTGDPDSDATIQNAAANVGASVQIQSVNDHYSLKNLKTTKTTAQSIKTYHTQLAAVLSTYNDNTADINVIVEALQTGDFSNISQLSASAATYRALADKISKITVPITAAEFQLDVMNGLYGMADSFQYLVQIQSDSIQGLSGIVAYRKYDIQFESALTDIHTYFVRYGILSS